MTSSHKAKTESMICVLFKRSNGMNVPNTLVEHFKDTTFSIQCSRLTNDLENKEERRLIDSNQN